MFRRVLGRRAWARLALSGLAFGFVVLAVVAGLGIVSTDRAIRTVNVADRITTVWNAAFIQVSEESEAMNDYLRNPDAVGIALLESIIGSAASSFDWLHGHVGAGATSRVEVAQEAYAGFTAILRDVVAAGVRGDQRQVLDQVSEASLGAAGLRKLLTNDLVAQRYQLTTDLGQVDQANRRLRAAALVVMVVDAILLVICALLLISYQRRIERFADSSRREARQDALTGLGNRLLLDERLNRAVQHAQESGDPVALLLMDLDGFKGVNDTLGHHVGDLLLKRVADRLLGAVRHTDVVARLGGDEFAVLVSDVRTVERAAMIAEKVLIALQQPADLDGTLVDVTASIGVAMCPTHSGDAHQLLQRADIAMYTAKRGHLGTAVYVDPDSSDSPVQILLLGELRRAIDRHELILHYQPKIRTKTRELGGVEALVRWQHPDRGLIAPAEFIPMAEQSGLMPRLTDYVLTAALTRVAAWRRAGWEVPVAVNIGARCLLDPTFPASVGQRLAECGVPAGMVTLEITETSLIGDPVRARELLSQLRDLGVRLSIDDFGTGYSSLTHLVTMPVQEIKIDRSFVSSMRTEASHRLIVRAVINLGLSLGLDVVAEGIEDDPTWVDLAAWRCTFGQGYFLGRPMPPDDFIDWLTRRTDALIG